ncbi:hypothetical protein [Xanthocytophaga agilis]|uniref:Cell surface protein SprA n=1 Tax=Xanthocytophaga agilis TaxID=3048010 RepID=A0AAE3UCR5_9BACT|nr:hypothetical protein [Xanthocytophaga agilis]MDJ1500385.1 hypothetical protein [Xanthocytophaga agilis]
MHQLLKTEIQVSNLKLCWVHAIGGFVFFLLLSSQSYGQMSTIRSKWVYPHGLFLPIDTLNIDPASIKVLYPQDATIHTTYSATKNTLQFTGIQLPDSILISYRVLPLFLAKPVYHRDPDTYDKVVYFGGIDPNRRNANNQREKREEFFATKGVQKTGSITRGISFGNSQSVFVNSALNLQLEGQLTDDIALKAIISDQSVPFQPEGNTQTLQEFDKVFVQLRSKSWQLAAGDIVFRNPLWKNRISEPSSFLRYYKNVQGVAAETNYEALGGRAYTSMGLAVSKGKFLSTEVTVTEGVQGPYRLRGANNEKNIIVLANSERVYLDGRLLTRGFNNDYIIDYNTAEITFSTTLVITAYSKVRVDFEYSDQNYSRSILTLTHKQELGKFTWFTNYYNEKDNPNKSFTLDLTEADKILLGQVDSKETAGWVSGVSVVSEYSASLILYKKVDTVYNGESYPVYINTTVASDKLYKIQFGEVGEGKGNYIKSSTTLNGQVYKWVPPLNGVPQGRYDTLQSVPLPSQRRMLTSGLEYQLGKNETLYGEVAFSERNLNLFSQINQQSNTGNAFKIGYTNHGKAIPFMPKLEWWGNVSYEQDSRTFYAIDRFRDVNFDNDWTLTDTTATKDHITSVLVGIRKNINFNQPVKLNGNPVNDELTKDLLTTPAAIPAINPVPSSSFTPSASSDQLVYRFNHRDRSGILNGHQHRLDISKQIRRLQLTANGFWMYSRQQEKWTDWQRLQTIIEYKGKYLSPGYAFSMDKNRIISRIIADSVISTTTNFEENRFFLRNGDSLKAHLQLDFALRQDYLPFEGRLYKSTFARTANMKFLTNQRSQNTLQLNLTYRLLEVQNTSLGLKNSETIMGRVDWNSYWLKKSIRSEFSLTNSSGLVPKREYVYLPVPLGQGTHTWRDDNGDGVQQLNEFYEAVNPDEKQYAKYFVATSDYIQAFAQNMSYRLNITPPVKWKAGNSIFRTLARFSSVSAWTINQQTTNNGLVKRLLPVGQDVRAADIVSVQESLRSTLFYNRTNPKYGGDIGYLKTISKQLLSGRTDDGDNFELVQKTEWRLNAKMNLSKVFSLKNTLVQKQTISESNLLTARNYEVVGRQISPELAFQPLSTFRIAGVYSYSFKKNVQNKEVDESSRIHSLSTEVRWARASKHTITTALRWVRINFKGDASTSVGYELLEALSPGTNWTWNLNWQQRLANGLQVNLGYNGRKSGTQNVVHIGSMQVTALF